MDIFHFKYKYKCQIFKLQTKSFIHLEKNQEINRFPDNHPHFKYQTQTTNNIHLPSLSLAYSHYYITIKWAFYFRSDKNPFLLSSPVSPISYSFYFPHFCFLVFFFFSFLVPQSFSKCKESLTTIIFHIMKQFAY